MIRADEHSEPTDVDRSYGELLYRGSADEWSYEDQRWFDHYGDQLHEVDRHEVTATLDERYSLARGYDRELLLERGLRTVEGLGADAYEDPGPEDHSCDPYLSEDARSVLDAALADEWVEISRVRREERHAARPRYALAVRRRRGRPHARRRRVGRRVASRARGPDSDSDEPPLAAANYQQRRGGAS